MQQAPSTGGGMMSGIGSTIVTGMALGAGSEVGHQVVRSFMGGSGGHKEESKEVAPQQQAAAPQQYYQQPPPEYYQQQQQQAAPQQNPCNSFNQHLINCLKNNQNDINLCQTNMDMLMQCEKDFAPKTNFYGVWLLLLEKS